MSSGWRHITLGAVLNFRRGHDLPKARMQNGSIPVMGSNGIIGYHNKWTTPSPCISIGRSGNIGKPKIIFEDCWAHNTTLYVDDFKGNNPRFLYYFLFKLNLHSYRSGSAVPTLNRNHIHPIDVSIPPLPEQKAIAHILGTLDHKIELNRKMNETLEAMAQALFKSWFVDFDPVLDKALAAGNPIPEALQAKVDKRKAVHKSGQYKPLPKNIQDLFPAAFEYNDELGKWIPEGWEVKNFRDLASLNPESWTKKTMPNSINYIDLSNTNAGKIEAVTFYKKDDAPSRARRIVRPNDIIIGTVRPGNKSYAYIQEYNLTASTGFAVIRAEKNNVSPYLYFALTNCKAIEYFAHIADGGAYPAIRPDVVIDYRSVVPSFACIKKYGELVSQKIIKIGSNNETEISLGIVQ